MSFWSWLLGRAMRLPPALTRRIEVERDIEVKMPDGVVLLADHYAPALPGPLPAVLIRSPYGRRAPWSMLPLLLAERGYHVLLQSARGTFGSGGELTPLRNEASDGRATLAWLSRQPWFHERLAFFGPSYLGFVQWAVAADLPPFVKALSVQLSGSQFRSVFYPSESFALDTGLFWAYLVNVQERPVWRLLLAFLLHRRALGPAFRHAPLLEADKIATGREAPFFRAWLEHNAPDDPYWKEIDFSRDVAGVRAPVNLLSGWYDLVLPATLADYEALRSAGRDPYLTIGPWSHVTTPLGVMLREALSWFDAHLRGDPSRLRPSPVRIHVMGSGRTRDLDRWPPPFVETRLHLQAARGLALEAPGDAPPDEYRYDPQDPTPAVGGTSLSSNSGPKDNRALEARADVLTYTSARLERELEVIGPVAAELFVSSSLAHTDFFARLCDVEPGGRSINVCDGLVRLQPDAAPLGPDGARRVRIDLWPTAYCFRPRHRLRLQISSGAHPRYARNLGSGEPLGTATTFQIAEQRVYHDPSRPSAILLPLAPGTTIG